MAQTDEWREGSVEDRLEYALIKVKYLMIRLDLWEDFQTSLSYPKTHSGLTDI